jgi:hypothetical protein
VEIWRAVTQMPHRVWKSISSTLYLVALAPAAQRSLRQSGQAQTVHHALHLFGEARRAAGLEVSAAQRHGGLDAAKLV